MREISVMIICFKIGFFFKIQVVVFNSHSFNFLALQTPKTLFNQLIARKFIGLCLLNDSVMREM